MAGTTEAGVAFVVLDRDASPDHPAMFPTSAASSSAWLWFNLGSQALWYLTGRSVSVVAVAPPRHSVTS